MVKYFCDWCGTEIGPDNTPSGGFHGVAGRLGTVVEASGQRLEIEVLHRFDKTNTSGHICKYCLLDALARLDDRPRVATDATREKPE